jgi:hypothetical protein
MNHLIGRQYVHLDLQGSESDGLAMQNRLPELCRDSLLPALERVLDRYSPVEGRLCIERLEIDVGVIAAERLERELPEAIARALETALREQMPPGEATGPSHRRENDHSTLSSELKHPAGSDEGANIRLKSERQSAQEVFLYFLETGRLPWSFRLPAGVALEQYLADFRQKQDGDSFFTGAAASRTLRLAIARRRLVLQFSVPFLDVLLGDLSGAARDSVRLIRTAIGKSSTPASGSHEHRSFEKQLWETAFGQAATGGETTAPVLAALAIAATPEAAPVVLPGLKKTLGLSLPAFVQVLQKEAMADFPALVPHLRAIFGREIQEMPEIKGVSKMRSSRNQAPPSADAPAGDPVPDQMPGGKKEKAPGKRPGAEPSPESIPEEGVYVDNAGVVILHPFLQMFFEGLGIARDGALLQPDRALHLLHFLCTGQTPAPEYELVLPKVLCNIPTETPVDGDIVLTDKEKDEALALLEAAIRWWEALRDTSPNALRGTFLCRPGKLSVREDGDWLLQVERQSYDILLDHLPWGISAVKLPWMEEMLWVEWG